MPLKKIKEAECRLSPGMMAMCRGRKKCGPLFPRKGELLQDRFEILYSEYDKSEGIEDRTGCAAGGAGGCIYYAVDHDGGDEVAIKFYSPIRVSKDASDEPGLNHLDECYSDKELLKLFEEEIDLVRFLSELPPRESLYFPSFLASGRYRRKRPYYVMEKLEALSSGDISDEKKCERIILAVCQAAQVLANHEKIALDIKPDNIMLRGANRQVVLVDMGLVADKKKYGDILKSMTSAYRDMSLNARCGTPGFFSELYSPHHESRMIYAIGGLIETLFGEKLLPEWQRITFRCRRVEEQYCFPSLEILIRMIRGRKSMTRTLTRLSFEQQSRTSLKNEVINATNVTKIDVPWRIAILDPKIRRELECGTRRKCEQEQKCEQADLPGLMTDCGVSSEAARNHLGWRVADDGSIQIIHGQMSETSGRMAGYVGEEPYVIQKGVYPGRESTWVIKEPLRVTGRVVIIVGGPGVVDMDLVGNAETTVILNGNVTLINRAKNVENDKTTYHLGNYSYLNFRHGCESARNEYSMRVFQSLQGPSFVRFNGPKSFGSLIAAQTETVKESLNGCFGGFHSTFLKTMIDG